MGIFFLLEIRDTCNSWIVLSQQIQWSNKSHASENWFLHETICTRTRIENEGKGNSEMAYCKQFLHARNVTLAAKVMLIF